MQHDAALRHFSALLVLIAGLAEAATASALPILDQSSFVSDGSHDGGRGFSNAAANGNTQVAQTFAVANTGTLTRIDLLVGNQWATLSGKNPNFLFDVRPVAAGAPVEGNELALFSTAVQILDQGPRIVSITGLAIPVVSGDALAIVLAADFNGAFDWFGSAIAYSGGSTFVREPDSTEAPTNTWRLDSPGRSFAFQSFVECANAAACTPAIVAAPPRPAQVFEPSALSLLGIGIVMLGLLRAGQRAERSIRRHTRRRWDVASAG
jgi:hypothetical protein